MSARPYLIGIAGPSCSGKSLLARRLAEALDGYDPVVLPMDAYYRDLSHLDLSAREERNFDEPEALEWPLFRRQLRMLASGEPIERPIYDYTLHTRLPATAKVVPGGVIIVEGLFALLCREIVELLNIRVFIDVADRVAYERRYRRDTRERGSTPGYVAAQYEASVRPMCLAHVLPTRRLADLVVSGEQPLRESAETVLAHVRSDLRRR